MNCRVEVSRRKFDKKAQTALDHQKARRIIAEAKKHLASIRLVEGDDYAALYELAMHSLTRREHAQPQQRPAAKTGRQQEIERVFGGQNG
jgi:hypothetical protein